MRLTEQQIEELTKKEAYNRGYKDGKLDAEYEKYVDKEPSKGMAISLIIVGLMMIIGSILVMLLNGSSSFVIFILLGLFCIVVGAFDYCEAAKRNKEEQKY